MNLKIIQDSSHKQKGKVVRYTKLTKKVVATLGLGSDSSERIEIQDKKIDTPSSHYYKQNYNF